MASGILTNTTGIRTGTGGRWVKGPATCACCGGVINPCVNAPSAIAIYQYTDTYFSPCIDCTAGLAADCVWDGTFQFFDSNACTFSNGQCFSGPTCFACKFHSVRMWEYDPPGISSVAYNASTTTFTMQIICQNGGFSGEVVWLGTKVGGLFSGTYTRTGGCDTRATVIIA